MYKVTKLRADDYKVFFDECRVAGLVNSDGVIIASSHDYSLDLIGDLYKPTGGTLTDDDGSEYPEMEKIDGYHANLKSKIELGIEHLAINVENPQRKFAGD